MTLISYRSSFNTISHSQLVFRFHTPINGIRLLLRNVDAPEDIEASDWTRWVLSPDQASTIASLPLTLDKLQDADYPGIVPYSQSRAMFSGDLEFEERSVRGSLVVGLSDEDIRLLDFFEGNEYTRKLVIVHPLGPSVALGAAGVVPKDPPPVPSPSELKTPLKVNTYVWCRPLSGLQPKLWTFEEFVEQNAWKWIGPASRDNRDYTEVDRRRAMEGIIAVRAEA